MVVSAVVVNAAVVRGVELAVVGGSVTAGRTALVRGAVDVARRGVAVGEVVDEEVS